MLSPLIQAHQWGQLDIAGHGTFKDARLFPGGARAWDWTETGTRHTPGVQIADVEALLTHEPEVVILSLGRERHLQVPASTVSWLQRRGVSVYVLETSQAIDLYNRLAPHTAVAALIHSTC